MKEILRMNYKWGDLLYEFPAETKWTVYRRLDIVWKMHTSFLIINECITSKKNFKIYE